MPKPAPKTITGTIPAGGSITPPIDLTQGSVAFVIGPDGWDDAPISFQVSVDFEAFFDLFDNAGFEVTRPVIEGAAVELKSSLTQAAMYLKIRSGSRVTPKAQSADRVFSLVIL